MSAFNNKTLFTGLYFYFLATQINSIANVISAKNVKYCPFYC